MAELVWISEPFNKAENNAKSENASDKNIAHLKGHYLEEQGSPEEALKIYQNDAKNNLESKLSEARLMIERNLLCKPQKELEEILKLDRNNPNALIYSGQILRQKKDFRGAALAFSKALDSNSFRDLALLGAAQNCVSQKDYRRGITVLKELLEYGAGNSKAIALYALCKRKLRLNNIESIAQADKVFPFAPLLLGEKYFAGANENANDLFGNRELVLETACEYISLFEYEDAIRILAGSQMEIDKQGLYILAWIFSKKGDNSKANETLIQAQNASWETWDAFRNIIEDALRYGIEKNPEDSTALYQLGCLLAKNNRWEESLALWKEVKSKEKAFALRNIGLYYWKKKSDPELAIKYYEESVKLPNVGARTIMEANLLFEEKNKNAESLQLFSDKEETIEQDSRLELALIRACLKNDAPEKAYSLLLEGNFCLCEGKMQSRILYENACEKMALNMLCDNRIKEAAGFYLKAAEYPENIGIGKPAANREAEWFFKAGKIYEKAGMKNKALESYKMGAEKGDFLDIDFFPLKNILWEAEWERIDVRYWKNLIYRAACLRETEKIEEANKLFSKIEEYLEFLMETERSDTSEVVSLSSTKEKFTGKKETVTSSPTSLS
jgi:predicted Zn-dependent protease